MSRCAGAFFLEIFVAQSYCSLASVRSINIDELWWLVVFSFHGIALLPKADISLCRFHNESPSVH